MVQLNLNVAGPWGSNELQRTCCYCKKWTGNDDCYRQAVIDAAWTEPFLLHESQLKDKKRKEKKRKENNLKWQWNR